MRILFVCKSNAARSQMAEAFFERYSKRNTATSAGVRTEYRHKVGHPVPRQVAEKMEQIGISMDRHRRRQLTRRLAEGADRIVVILTKGQARALLPQYIKRSKKVIYWTDVRDPQNDRARVEARNKINRLVRALVRDIG